MKIQIENLIPKGYKVESFNMETQTLNLGIIKKDPKEMFNTTDDILQYHGKTQESFNEECKGLSNSEIGFKWERLIARAYNLGVGVDPTKRRYYVVFNVSPFSFDFVTYVQSHTNVPLALCFNEEENCIDAAKKFLPQYKLSKLSSD